MKINESMVIEKHDLDYILNAYLRSYIFYNRGIPPTKITIPLVLELINPQSPDPFLHKIPIEYVEYKPEAGVVEPEEALLKGEPVDTNRPSRARRIRKTNSAVSTDSEDAIKPNKKK